MLPILLDLKFIKIYTFGVFLVLSLFWGAYLLWRNIRLTSLKEEDVFDGLFLSLIAAFIVGRLTYIGFNFDKFKLDILKIILVNGYPGLSYVGCLAGGIVALWLYMTWRKIKFLEIIDYFMAPLLLALGMAEVGSFFAGIEVGTKTNLFLAIHYLGYDGQRHLTAFYEAVLFIAGSFLANKLLYEVRRERYDAGFVFWLTIWYIACVSFIFDNLKVNHLYLLGKSFNWLISLIILLTLSLFFIYYFKNQIWQSLVSLAKLSKSHDKKINPRRVDKTGR